MFGRNNRLETAWLSSTSFFADFNEDELDAVSALGQRREVAVATELVDQGRVGDECFVIVDGTATVSIGGEFVASLGAGAIVGEMALVEHTPRSATVTAETDLVVVAYDTRQFKKLLEKSPTTYERVMSTLHARVKENENRL